MEEMKYRTVRVTHCQYRQENTVTVGDLATATTEWSYL